MFRMPGTSFGGPLLPLTDEEEKSRLRLQAHVDVLAGQIGERNFVKIRALDAAANYVQGSYQKIGYDAVSRDHLIDGRVFRNLEAVVSGDSREEEIILVGAHYDTVIGSPGADDNATGVAALLEIAQLIKEDRPARSIRFVGFPNEEPPFFLTDRMGSRIYAREAKQRGDKIVAMLSLEAIGYYSSEPHSQNYPLTFNLIYPDRGDFIAFVGNLSSRALVRRTIGIFRQHARFPSEGVAAPAWIPGINWSDQDSFWQEGYPAVMITDTAFFRNPHYHRSTDTPETVDYAGLARVVYGLAEVVRGLGQPDE